MFLCYKLPTFNYIFIETVPNHVVKSDISGKKKMLKTFHFALT